MTHPNRSSHFCTHFRNWSYATLQNKSMGTDFQLLLSNPVSVHTHTFSFPWLIKKIFTIPEKLVFFFHLCSQVLMGKWCDMGEFCWESKHPGTWVGAVEDWEDHWEACVRTVECEVAGMAQWVKAVTAEADGLSLISELTQWKERIHLCKLSSDLWHTCPLLHVNKC